MYPKNASSATITTIAMTPKKIRAGIEKLGRSGLAILRVAVHLDFHLLHATTDVQKAQRFAAIGILLRHSGQFFSVGSAGFSPRRNRAMIVFTGNTTNTYTAVAIKRNETSAFKKSPTMNLLPFIVKLISEKSGLPTRAAMSGVIKSFTSAVTTAPKAAPSTTATARSTTLPRKRNCLNPFIATSVSQYIRPNTDLRRSAVKSNESSVCGRVAQVDRASA